MTPTPTFDDMRAEMDEREAAGHVATLRLRLFTDPAEVRGAIDAAERAVAAAGAGLDSLDPLQRLAIRVLIDSANLKFW